MAENSLTEAFNPLQVIEEEGEGDRYAAELMRNKVAEIISSYHHQFDHFYESVQNEWMRVRGHLGRQRQKGRVRTILLQ